MPPDVVAAEINVLLSQRREVLRDFVGNPLNLAQRGDRAVAGLPKPMTGDSACQAVAWLTLVERASGATAQFGFLVPIEGEQGALESAQFAQRRCNVVHTAGRLQTGA